MINKKYVTVSYPDFYRLSELPPPKHKHTIDLNNPNNTQKAILG